MHAERMYNSACNMKGKTTEKRKGWGLPGVGEA